MMKETINFIKKGFNRNNPVDIYKFVSIKEGSIQVNNGIFALSCPIGLGDTVVPEGISFIRAMERCQDTTSMSILASGKLKIKSGKFSASIKCSTNIFPRLVPEGEVYEVDWDLGEELKPLLAFAREDNNKPWATGIMFNGQSAMVTDNICLVEKWLSNLFPVSVNIPSPTIKCLCAIGEKVKAIQVTGHRVVFHFDGNKWLSTSLIHQGWPDVSSILNVTSNQQPVPEGLEEVVKSLKTKNGLLTFSEGTVSDGTLAYEVSVDVNKKFSSEHLANVLKVSTTIDLVTVGSHTLFFGDNLRGVIARIL